MTSVLDTTLLTLKVGAVATLINLVPGVLTGWWLAHARFRGRTLVQALVMLPMVLPPVAIGLVLLVLFARGSFLGGLIERMFGAPILLTWPAAALAAAVMSFPLVVLGAQQGFRAVPRRLEQVARTLGARGWTVFFRISLPLAKRSIAYGLVFGFARSLGEFGATTLVAGHIPGETETLALAIYARIESFQEREALLLSGVSVLLALALTGAAELWLRTKAER